MESGVTYYRRPITILCTPASMLRQAIDRLVASPLSSLTMAHRRVTMGTEAPPFTLPCAQGGHVELEKYRGRAAVVLWFTKGFGCPFCRQQMSQFARQYSRFTAGGAEILAVTRTDPTRAAAYARQFTIPFPYLCDPADATRHAYGLAVRENSAGWYLRKVAKAVTKGTGYPDDYGPSGVLGAAPGFSPSLSEVRKAMDDEDTAVFVIDRAGVVRFADVGGFRENGGVGALRALPSTDDILHVLERCPD